MTQTSVTPHHDRLPAWVPRADRALGLASRAVRVIRCATPVDYRAELDRRVDRWTAGRREAQSFSYQPVPELSQVRSGLEALVAALGDQGALGRLYADRAAELALEASICQAVGGPDVRELAMQRFAPPSDELAHADALADRWLSEPAPRASRPRTVRTDDEQHPDSLVSLMRRGVGELRLGVRVVVVRDLASLAATGDGAVQVVAGREVDASAARRTVLHELEGHVLPGVRARSLPIGLFSIGTARGSDDQEGRALALERKSKLLDYDRRRELALRHVAARAVGTGADFPDTTRLLLDHGAPVADAVRISCRVHRGGGIAREIVYLPALLRYEAAPETESILRLGRVSVAAAPVLHALT